MRLINATTLKLEEFVGKDVPKYAILSHTWSNDEITFADMDSGNAQAKAGYHKIVHGCRLTLSFGYSHIWIDTCCIDKKSSAELSEAINSMYKYYQKSSICFAYLVDAEPCSKDAIEAKALKKCKWLYRSWTLQELIAPMHVYFYARDWSLLGTKVHLLSKLAEVTRIDTTVLLHEVEKARFSVAQRMSWAAERMATREEDLAYSLLGLFDVNIPLLYGEGTKAFTRLQEEIIKSSDDQSIFAWKTKADIELNDLCPWVKGYHKPTTERHGFFASSPGDFQMSGGVLSYSDRDDRVYSMTNKGIQAVFPKLSHKVGHYQVIMLNCYYDNDLEVSLALAALPTDRASGQLVRAIHSLVRVRERDLSKYGFQKPVIESLFLSPAPPTVISGTNRCGSIYIKPSIDHTVLKASASHSPELFKAWDANLQILHASPGANSKWQAEIRFQMKDNDGCPTGTPFDMIFDASRWYNEATAPIKAPNFRIRFNKTEMFALKRGDGVFVGTARKALYIEIVIRNVKGQTMYVIETAGQTGLPREQWGRFSKFGIGGIDKELNTRFLHHRIRRMISDRDQRRNMAWKTLMDL